MTRSTALLVACLPALLLAPTSACEKSRATAAPSEASDAVDGLTRELLGALAAGDRDGAAKLCHAELAAELDERTVAVIGRTLTWLGPVAELGRAHEESVVDGVMRRYRVGFERDELTLEITVVGAKIEGFEFDEGQWQALSDRATEASAGSLRIAEFAFLDPEGAILAGPLDPAAIRYRIALEGLDAQLREHHVTVAKSVVDAEGNEVYRQRQDDDIRFPQAETGSSGGRIEGGVAVPGAGTYELILEITDLVGGQAITHRVALTID